MTTAAERAVEAVTAGALPAPEDVARHRRAQRRGRLALAYALGATALFLVVMVLVLLGDTRAFDLRATELVQRLHSPGVYPLLLAVSWLGFSPQSEVIAAAIVALLFWRRLRLEAGFALLAFAVSPLNEAILKRLVHRARPAAALDGIVVHGKVSGSSFPSGHVLTYVLICGFLAYLAHTLVQPRALRAALIALCLALIALVGPSRVYLGQHWTTDVLGSYLLGSALLVALLAAYRRAKARQLARARAALAASGQ